MLELVLSSVGSALVAAALWLGRTWIKERLTASIRLDTERDLAKLKSDLDRASQRIKMSHLLVLRQTRRWRVLFLNTALAQ